MQSELQGFFNIHEMLLPWTALYNIRSSLDLFFPRLPCWVCYKIKSLYISVVLQRNKLRCIVKAEAFLAKIKRRIPEMRKRILVVFLYGLLWIHFFIATSCCFCRHHQLIEGTHKVFIHLFIHFFSTTYIFVMQIIRIVHSS